jgi:hypothetical protein
MRTLNGAALTLLARVAAGDQIPLVQLVELQLATTVRLTTAGGPITWGGNTWQPAGLGRIEAIDDSAQELQALQFTLPGVSSGHLSLVLNEQVEGKTVRVYDALIDPATGQVADAVLAWAGTLNVPAIEDGATATVAVTAEHRGVHALRAKPSRYTNDEQQRLFPGDTSLNFDPATDAAPIAWPAASFFKQT